jgi:hypothetical protein
LFQRFELRWRRKEGKPDYYVVEDYRSSNLGSSLGIGLMAKSDVTCSSEKSNILVIVKKLDGNAPEEAGR